MSEEKSNHILLKRLEELIKEKYYENSHAPLTSNEAKYRVLNQYVEFNQETREFIDTICKEEVVKIYPVLSQRCLGVMADYSYKGRLNYIERLRSCYVYENNLIKRKHFNFSLLGLFSLCSFFISIFYLTGFIIEYFFQDIFLVNILPQMFFWFVVNIISIAGINYSFLHKKKIPNPFILMRDNRMDFYLILGT
tara:strand:+ start:504 stop:1085 length:582 start_codon:yes stop_codon:yes gene_type:complete